MDNLFINPARMNALRARLISFGDSDGKMAWDSFDYSPPDGLASLDFDVVDGTAIISVNGALASAQIPYWYAMADLTYENLIAAVSEAANDGEVERILLRMNSPGGTVTGCAEAAALLDKLAEQVPIWAHCQMADSAAYWLASAANRIIVDPTGEAGSIGTIMTHTDMSKMLAEWGIDVTHIFSGDKKADGSPYEPLSKDALARFQAEVDYLRGIFVDSVSGYRQMDSKALMDTQADTYIGQMAVDAGLADETGFFNDVLNAMAARTGSSIFTQTANNKETTMAKKATTTKSADDEKKPADAKADNSDCTCDDNESDDSSGKKDAKSADVTVKIDVSEAAASAMAAAQVDQKARCAAIIGHAEAAGRTELAHELAFSTDLTPEAAGKLLAKAPKTEAKAENALDKAMKAQGSAKVGAGGGEAKENTLVADMTRRFAKK
jgi:signal peptide peptidase SppA